MADRVLERYRRAAGLPPDAFGQPEVRTDGPGSWRFVYAATRARPRRVVTVIVDPGGRAERRLEIDSAGAP